MRLLGAIGWILLQYRVLNTNACHAFRNFISKRLQMLNNIFFIYKHMQLSVGASHIKNVKTQDYFSKPLFASQCVLNIDRSSISKKRGN